MSDCIILAEFSEIEGPIARIVLTATEQTGAQLTKSGSDAINSSSDSHVQLTELHHYPGYEQRAALEQETAAVRGVSVTCGWISEPSASTQLEGMTQLPIDHFVLRFMSVEPVTWTKHWTVVMQLPYKVGSSSPALSPTTSPVVRGADPLTGVNTSHVVHAVVVHFYVLDIEARGYQRPLALVYLTRDQDKIDRHFSEMARDLRGAMEAIKQHNNATFLHELDCRLADLRHTQRVIAQTGPGRELADSAELAAERRIDPAEAALNTADHVPIIPPTPGTVSEVIGDLTAFKSKLLAETSATRDLDESRDEDDEEENAFHSAEEPSTSTNNEESESDSEADEDCKKLLEITREIDHVPDAHRHYTPKLLKSLLFRTPVTLVADGHVTAQRNSLRALPELLSRDYYLNRLRPALHTTLLKFQLPHVLYRVEPVEHVTANVDPHVTSSLFMNQTPLLDFNYQSRDLGLSAEQQALVDLLWPAEFYQDGARGQGLLALLIGRQHGTISAHVIRALVYSLLRGRPVIIQGSNQSLVRDRVRALAYLLLGQYHAVEWCDTSKLGNRLTLAHLALHRIRLVGVAKSTVIPQHVYNYATVWALEDEPINNGKDLAWLWGPLTSTTSLLLAALLSTRRQWPDEESYLYHVRTTLYEWSTRAYVCHHSTLHSTRRPARGSVSSPHNSLTRTGGGQARDLQARDLQARDAQSRDQVLKRLGVSDTCDSEVLEHVIGLIREQTHEHVRTMQHTATSSSSTAASAAPPCFKLDYHPCKKILNKDK